MHTRSFDYGVPYVGRGPQPWLRGQAALGAAIFELMYVPAAGFGIMGGRPWDLAPVIAPFVEGAVLISTPASSMMTPPGGLDPHVAGVLLFADAVAQGIGIAVFASGLRDALARTAATRGRRRRVASAVWSLSPSASTTSVGLTMRVVGW